MIVVWTSLALALECPVGDDSGLVAAAANAMCTSITLNSGTYDGDGLSFTTSEVTSADPTMPAALNGALTFTNPVTVSNVSLGADVGPGRAVITAHADLALRNVTVAGNAGTPNIDARDDVDVTDSRLCGLDGSFMFTVDGDLLIKRTVFYDNSASLVNATHTGGLNIERSTFYESPGAASALT